MKAVTDSVRSGMILVVTSWNWFSVEPVEATDRLPEF